MVILGSGTPNPDPDRSGPAVAIIAGGRAYLVDAGPGVVRRAAQAVRDRGIDALRVERLGIAFNYPPPFGPYRRPPDLPHVLGRRTR